MAIKKRRKKGIERSAEEKRALEVSNRRRAKKNARAMHDPYDDLDQMNRTEFLVARRRIIEGRVTGELPSDVSIQLTPWKPVDRVLAAIILPGRCLLVRNPASMKRRNRRKPSALDMYYRLPKFPALPEAYPEQTSDQVAQEAIGTGSLERIGFYSTTCPVTGRGVLVGVYRGASFDPDRWGWRSVPLDDPELAPEEDAVLRDALAELAALECSNPRSTKDFP